MLFLFEKFCVDSRRRELRQGDEVRLIEPQVFDLLEYLIRNRDHMVTRDDLLAAVWNGRIVSESTLASRINAARSAIGDNGEEQRLIRTVVRKGVRFVADVKEERETPTTASASEYPTLPAKPSIAVLPFQHLRGDPGRA